MAVRFLVTGGTIDDIDYKNPKDAPARRKSLIPKLLEQAKFMSKYNVSVILQKDSRFFAKKELDLIYHNCKNSKEDKIIITHGTITMVETAKYLGQKKLSKTIVLVGAKIPANNKKSDAMSNLGGAFAAVQLLPHGVFIFINGKLFVWNNVKKNFKKGIFETLR
jgi:L-asparaginase